MARVTGLTLRGGVYQLRTTIPTDLRDRFGRSCIRQSLRTSDRQQAELLGSAERTRLLALFNAARKAPTQAIQDLSAHHRVIEGIDFSLGTNQQPLLQTPAKSQQRQAKAPPLAPSTSLYPRCASFTNAGCRSKSAPKAAKTLAWWPCKRVSKPSAP